MKIKNGLLVVILIAFIGVLALQIFMLTEKQQAYIDIIRVFNEFKLKKELSTKLEDIQLKRTEKLDSLKIRYQAALVEFEKKDKKEANVREIELIRQEYIIKEQQFKEDNENMSAQYNDQVWTQLNAYLKEYGEKSGYEFIFGANGQGSLIYAKKDKEITDDVIKFVNNKYDGMK
ncbi:MAG: OmpH family outer membrane protein [Bacteroidia bacterium]